MNIKNITNRGIISKHDYVNICLFIGYNTGIKLVKYKSWSLYWNILDLNNETESLEYMKFGGSID